MNRWQFNEAFEGLTPRRRQVLKLLLAGVSDQDIAQSLHIETSTVRKHVENICLSFNLRNEFPDERRSKRGELIALFAKYQPELVTRQTFSVTHQNSSEVGEDENRQIVRQENTEIRVTREVRLNLKNKSDSLLSNRDIFILIDQSGSMVRKDEDTGKQTRYEYLAEVVEGHIAAILSVGSDLRTQIDEKIARKQSDLTDNDVSVYFFSRERVKPKPIVINDASQVWKLFVKNQPKTKTFVAPTLNHCVNTWLTEGKPQGKGAFFIIYTDGQFDDEERFVHCIASACTKIDNHKDIKFFVLGLGQDIDIEHFLALDFNVNQTMKFNIFVFDLVNEVDDIIELLQRQLTDDPYRAFPDWVRIRHPDLVEKVIQENRE